MEEQGIRKATFPEGSMSDSLDTGFCFRLEGNRANIPYSVRIDRVISSKRKHRRDRQLAELEALIPRPEDYAAECKRIQGIDIYAAQDVRAFLTKASVR